MKYTKQEIRFLEKLDFTPGPWEFSMGFIGAKKHPFVSCDHQTMDGMKIHNGKTIDEKINNARLISKSTDMFLYIFKQIKFIKKINELTGYKPQKATLYDYGCEILKSATNRTWQQLSDIWEECKNEN